MKQIVSTIIFLIPVTIFCQDWLYQEFIPKYSYEILDTNNLKKERSSRILRDLSFTGAYKELYAKDSHTDTSLQTYFTDLLNRAIPTNAKNYILSKSNARRIIIINESHHRPEHRVFTKSLLQKLYKQGYKYLALEAIASNQFKEYTNYPSNTLNLADTTIMSRGYPVMKPFSGTYVKEPQYGNMIREAIKIGFSIVGYEKNGKQRELYQAKSISDIFSQDPKAKVVIHCGYGHLWEQPKSRKGVLDTMMAGHLKKITGFDPLTINQTEYYNVKGLDRLVFTDVKDNSPQILLVDGVPFKSHKINEQSSWDITIFHNPIDFVNNRPLWLSSGANNQAFKLNKDVICISYPIRIKLLAKEDQLDAVPIDIIEVNNSDSSIPPLYGSNTDVKLVIENKRGDRQVIDVEKK